MPIFDNHFHLRPTGLGIVAAAQFEKAGGTALMLTHSPYDDIPIRGREDYARAFERTLSLADAVRRQTRLQVFVALGPYPVDLVHLAASIGLSGAMKVAKEGIDLAARHIANGAAVAIGEVGRPHFPVGDETLRTSNEILAYGMETARDLGCAIVLHTEDPTTETFREFASMADHAGLARAKVVKHHSTVLDAPDAYHRVVPSILAKEDLIERAVRTGGPFLLETDYIDDPRRPGAVLGPATVPRKTRALLERGVLTDDIVAQIHQELPTKIYGIPI